MICFLKVIHYFCLMFSKNVLKIYRLDPVKFLSAPGLKAALKA